MLTDFQKLIAELDHYLTGQDEVATQRAAERFCPATARDWLTENSGVYYLADAGLSRIGYYDGRLYLTGNSSEGVKARWEQAGTYRAAIEHHFRAASL